MNNKITLPEFVDAISKVTKKPKKVCELFVKEFFVTISEELINNDVVKIKNFGTFKKVYIEARKSVNVNTGEAVEIPKHCRITFLPTKEIQDAINAPFLCFETIALNDNLTENEINDIKNTNYESKVQSYDDLLREEVIKSDVTDVNEEMQVEHINDELNEKPVVVNPNVVEDIKVNDDSDKLIPAEVKEEPNANVAIDEEVGTEELLPKGSAGDDIKVEDEIVSAENSDKEIDTPVEEPQHELKNENEPLLDQSDNIQETTNNVGNCTVNSGLLLLFIGFASGIILTMITIILISIFSNSDSGIIKTYNNFIDNFRVSEDFAPEAIDTVSVMPIPVPIKGDTTSVKKDTVAVSSITAKKEIMKDSVVYDYIAPNVYPTTLARRHYGNTHFWVYIYEENKKVMPNPNLVRPGTKLVIPPPEKYGIDAKNTESINKAKVLEGKIQSKFSK